METLIIILGVIIFLLYLKVRKIQQQLTVLSFSNSVVSKILNSKELISHSEIEITTNELIGSMPEVDGNKIIKTAKKIGVTIPPYMDEEDIKKYIEKQDLNRKYKDIPYSDRLLFMENEGK